MCNRGQSEKLVSMIFFWPRSRKSAAADKMSIDEENKHSEIVILKMKTIAKKKKLSELNRSR